jgi:hypothetical protein
LWARSVISGLAFTLWGIEVKGRSIEEIDEQFARQTPTGVQAGHASDIVKPQALPALEPAMYYLAAWLPGLK